MEEESKGNRHADRRAAAAADDAVGCILHLRFFSSSLLTCFFLSFYFNLADGRSFCLAFYFCPMGYFVLSLWRRLYYGFFVFFGLLSWLLCRFFPSSGRKRWFRGGTGRAEHFANLLIPSATPSSIKRDGRKWAEMKKPAARTTADVMLKLTLRGVCRSYKYSKAFFLSLHHSFLEVHPGKKGKSGRCDDFGFRAPTRIFPDAVLQCKVRKINRS